ncbi:MAG: hypothetical protein M5T61_09885, partial [Acidimicrobiia bacterium]|nr:hypothetical protein [Acidimicrobiia bacterium]
KVNLVTGTQDSSTSAHHRPRHAPHARHTSRSGSDPSVAGAMSGILVFTNASEAPWDPNWIRRWFDLLCRRAGVEDTPAPRAAATAVSLAVRNGAGLEAVQKIAGHKSISTAADVCLPA